ncbi:monovalent cation/H+ antiporter complex subunit F [Wolbachia endosymbiont of Howardula sp.]|nr:monovalent cation/H+ antiporter complex subunit F [Wolbachia endosymbiont of Howardula sp.]UWI83418.1 monovalent cation/H+ antiporter complex subunit F [Wolbachia endosymbiont of Howardula sp.]
MLIQSHNIYIKVLVFNHFITQVILLITSISVLYNIQFLIDIALVYSSIGILSSISLMKFKLLNIR